MHSLFKNRDKLTHTHRDASFHTPSHLHTLEESVKWGEQVPKQSFSQTQVCSRPCHQLPLTGLASSNREREYDKRNERISLSRRKAGRIKERWRVNGSRVRDTEMVELVDSEKPESPCRLFRGFFVSHYGPLVLCVALVSG